MSAGGVHQVSGSTQGAVPFAGPTGAWPHPIRPTYRGLIFFAAAGVLISHALEAYQFLGVPVPWFAYGFAAVGLLLVVLRNKGRLRVPPTTGLVGLLLVYALLVHFIGVVTGLEVQMPPRASLPYPIFVISRFIVMGGFGLVLVFVYNAAQVVGRDKLIALVKWLAVGVSLAAIYIYLAQRYGWWEPPRNRLGTGGQDFLQQEVTFTYAFHRAIGTFREPSHLARWLVGPLILLGVGLRTVKGGIAFLVSAGVFALTGSVLGLLGVCAALVVLAATGIWSVRILKRASIATALIVGGGYGVAVLGDLPIFSVMQERLHTMFAEGIETTNRGYIYEYVRSSAPPLYGYGLGNANLVFSEYRGSILTSSHLSLFINAWFSLGILGVVCTAAIVLRPLISRRVWRCARKEPAAAALLGGIAAWVVAYIGGEEEFSVMFAVLAGLLWSCEAGEGNGRSMRAGSGRDVEQFGVAGA